MKTKIDIGNTYIFSDDIEWCKKKIKKHNLELNIIFPNLSCDVLDFYHLTLSKNIIISNSTFSWWGAYFGNTQNRLIYYPDIWFGPALQQLQTSQMFPTTWQKIDCI